MFDQFDCFFFLFHTKLGISILMQRRSFFSEICETFGNSQGNFFLLKIKWIILIWLTTNCTFNSMNKPFYSLNMSYVQFQWPLQKGRKFTQQKHTPFKAFIFTYCCTMIIGLQNALIAPLPPTKSFTKFIRAQKFNSYPQDFHILLSFFANIFWLKKNYSGSNEIHHNLVYLPKQNCCWVQWM